MADDRDPAAEASNALYDWWLQLLPTFAGAASAGTPHEQPAQPPFPADRIAAGLTQTRQLLDALYGGFLRALSVEGGDPLKAFEDLVQGRLAGLDEQIAQLGRLAAGAMPGAAGIGPADAPLQALARALEPLAQNLERTHGGLADAFGLAPLRSLDQALRELGTAMLAQRRAQADYLRIVATALHQGAQALSSRLAEKVARGESVDTLLELVRLWARTTDDALHDAMQSPDALQTTAALVRAGSSARQQQQRVVALVSEALDVPTRAELDEAFREIQELKRELRRSRKATAPAGPAPAPARRTKSPAGAKKTSKGARAA